MTELLKINGRQPVLGAVLERLEVHLADRLTEQVLERMLVESKRVRVVPVVGEGDEVLRAFWP